MRNLNSFLLPIFFIVLISCEEEEIGINDIIISTTFSKTELVANDSDASKVKVFFNYDSDVSKIKLKVEASNGIFIESKTNKIEVNAEKDSIDNIFAEFNLKSNTIHLDHELTFKIDNYERKSTIKSVKSVPESIKISSNSFSVNNNFQSEASLEALLTSNIGKKVSNGIKVRFIDTYMDGSQVNGSFRSANLTSNSESKVSIIYSPGVIEPNQYVIITVEVLDDNSNSIGISDNLQLYINKSN